MQNIVHFIWLTGTMPQHVVSNIRDWGIHLGKPPNEFLPILWLDRAFSDRLGPHRMPASPTRLSKTNPDAVAYLQSLGITLFGHYRPYSINPGSTSIIIAHVEDNQRFFSSVTRYWPFFAQVIQAECNIQVGGLPAVASDILRTALLRGCGGMYFDISDIEPNTAQPFCTVREADRYLLNGLLCRVKKDPNGNYEPENDIILVDVRHEQARYTLDTILERMHSAFRGDPQHRIKTSRPTPEVDAQIKDFLTRLKGPYDQKFSPEDSMSNARFLAEYLRAGRGKPVEILHFLKKYLEIPEKTDVLAYLFKYGLNASIDLTTYAPFVGSCKNHFYSAGSLSKAFRHSEAFIQNYFSPESREKHVFSWRTPGYGYAVESEYFAKLLKKVRREYTMRHPKTAPAGGAAAGGGEPTDGAAGSASDGTDSVNPDSKEDKK